MIPNPLDLRRDYTSELDQLKLVEGAVDTISKSINKTSVNNKRQIEKPLSTMKNIGDSRDTSTPPKPHHEPGGLSQTAHPAIEYHKKQNSYLGIPALPR